MRVPLSVCAALFCTACATQPYPSADSTPDVQPQTEAPLESATHPSDSAQSRPESDCREFTTPVTVEGKQQQAVGQACQQPDGSWKITQNTPGLAPQVYTLPPQAIYASPYPDPYYWEDPWIYGPAFFAGGSIFFEDGFHHFHDRDGFRHNHFHDGFHDGFHNAFHDGFHRGFHDGFHGGGFHNASHGVFHNSFHGGGFHGGGFHGGGHGGGGHR